MKRFRLNRRTQRRRYEAPYWRKRLIESLPPHMLDVYFRAGTHADTWYLAPITVPAWLEDEAHDDITDALRHWEPRGKAQ